MEHKRGCPKSSLADVLVDKRWAVRSEPFPHLVVPDVFQQAYYEELEQAFRWIQSKGLAEHHEDHRLSRNMNKYDAYSWCFPYAECGPFEIFFQREWHDLIAGIFNVPASGDVQVCLHHHKPGSLSGALHNDLNPAWFPDQKPGEINVATDVHNKPKPGQTTGKHRLVIRAISLIIFLNNPEWTEGDGGETGFYSFADQDVEQPDDFVAPRNNTMLAFECTTSSYHSFITNVSDQRNSIIMWLHRPYNEVCERFGAENIIWWKN